MRGQSDAEYEGEKVTILNVYMNVSLSYSDKSSATSVNNINKTVRV